MFAQIVGLVGILIGTATDIHHREVPDWVNYSMIAAGILLGTYYSIASATFAPLIASLAGLGLCYALGALMYYTGQWGGGDAKMIMGLGALLGVASINWLSSPPFLIIFLVFTLFAGAFYGLVWMLFLLVRDHQKVLPKAKEIAGSLRFVRYAVLALTALIAVAAFLLPTPFNFFMLMVAVFVYLTFYVLVAVKAVEKTCFVKQIQVSELVEGDWLVEDVTKKTKLIVEAQAEGISLADIEKLKKNNIKKVMVKEGIPFVPSFLIAYIAALWWTSSNLGWPFLS